MNWREISGRTLAYLGDAVWSLLVRRTLIQEGEGKGSELQKKTIAYVNAEAQASFYETMHADGFLSAEEEEAYHRGRNDSSSTRAHSTSVGNYRKATGFEAILGMHEIKGEGTRNEEIWQYIRQGKS